MNLLLKVASRGSPLARIQVEEVYREIVKYHPHVEFDPHYVDSRGDKDLKTSLRDMDKTDFFTREIDQLILQQHCRIAVHSAKDLPEPIPKGLRLIALTKGVDSSDVLVLRDNDTLETLPRLPKIASSSYRRDEAIKKWLPNCIIHDIRGSIHQRLDYLYQRKVDGVVMAEAAIIRLKLLLNRLKIPGETAPLQGRLAVIAHAEDKEMAELFRCISV
ncbi:MAG: hydroxymethylbilane synthase [Chlamydiales bacterium]